MDETLYTVIIRFLDGYERQFQRTGGFSVSREGILSVISLSDPDETPFVVAPGFWQWVEGYPIDEENLSVPEEDAR